MKLLENLSKPEEQQYLAGLLPYQSPKALAAPTILVPAEQISRPSPPAEDADLGAWREFHRQMVLWIDWQHDIEAWRGSVEARLEGIEEVTNLIPEILERLGPQTLTSDHQRAVQKYVQQVNKLTGKPYGSIYPRDAQRDDDFV